MIQPTMEPSSSRIPERALGDHRLVVHSVGQATPAVQQALRTVLGLPAERTVALLYQAPSILLDGIAPAFGSQLQSVLADAGLQTEVLSPDAPFSPGSGDREVAVHLTDPSKLPAVAAEIAAFLGCDLNRAAKICWASPALLIGNVSDATVDSIRARLAPLGVELDVSEPAESRYDVYLGDDDGLRSLVVRALTNEGVAHTERGPLVAVGLDKGQADRVWSTLAKRNSVRLLDHAFQRFDVRLDEATDSPELRAVLAEQCGMPDAVVPKLLNRLPIVLHSSVRHGDVTRLLAELDAVGARATGRLLTFLSFDLTVRTVTDPTAAASVLTAITGGEEAGLREKLRRPPFDLEGPFSQAQGLWMKAELKGAGVTAELSER